MGRWEAWSVVVFRSWPRHGTINVGNNKIVVGRMGNISFTAAYAVFFFMSSMLLLLLCVCVPLLILPLLMILLLMLLGMMC